MYLQMLKTGAITKPSSREVVRVEKSVRQEDDDDEIQDIALFVHIKFRKEDGSSAKEIDGEYARNSDTIKDQFNSFMLENGGKDSVCAFRVSLFTSILGRSSINEAEPSMEYSPGSKWDWTSTRALEFLASSYQLLNLELYDISESYKHTLRYIIDDNVSFFKKKFDTDEDGNVIEYNSLINDCIKPQYDIISNMKNVIRRVDMFFKYAPENAKEYIYVWARVKGDEEKTVFVNVDLKNPNNPTDAINTLTEIGSLPTFYEKKERAFEYYIKNKSPPFNVKITYGNMQWNSVTDFESYVVKNNLTYQKHDLGAVKFYVCEMLTLRFKNGREWGETINYIKMYVLVMQEACSNAAQKLPQFNPNDLKFVRSENYSIFYDEYDYADGERVEYQVGIYDNPYLALSSSDSISNMKNIKLRLQYLSDAQKSKPVIITIKKGNKRLGIWSTNGSNAVESWNNFMNMNSWNERIEGLKKPSRPLQ
jgi:hypothetical protein